MYRTLLITILLVLPISSYAEGNAGEVTDEKFGTWLWNYLTVGASITAGIGGRTVAIDVTRQDTNDKGRMADKREDELFLLYSTRPTYFGDSNVGFTWILNLSTMHLKKQELSNGDTENLGTEVKGYFATTVPTIFYNFGDRYRGHYLRAGIGLGIGIAKFSGDIILTDSSQPNDRVDISNGASNVFLAPGIFIDYQWKNFTFRIESAGPNINYDGYDINVSATSAVIGYTYYLKD